MFGVTDGGVYAHPVQLRIAGAGRVLLDGEAVSGETVVSASGTHTLVLYSADGKRSKTLSFTLRTAVSEADLKYTDLHAILDEENGVFLTYLGGRIQPAHPFHGQPFRRQTLDPAVRAGQSVGAGGIMAVAFPRGFVYRP